MIPHSRPWITEADVMAVTKVIRSERLAEGAALCQFEERMASWLGAAFAVATGSGAAALGVALDTLGVGAGDEVVIPTYVCHRVFDAVVRRGADVVLCDVGPHWVVTPDSVEPALSARTRAIVVPHMNGIFADVSAIARLGVPVIEDCAQALGAPTAHSDAGQILVCSFHPTKCLTTGQGGLVAAPGGHLAARLRHLTRHGVEAPMSDIDAALGLSQLARYTQALERRTAIASSYRGAIAPIAPAWLAHQIPSRSMHFRFPLVVNGDIDAVETRFANAGIRARRGLDRLLHRHLGLPDSDFAVAASLFDCTLCLPIYPALTDDEVGHIARTAAGVASEFVMEAA